MHVWKIDDEDELDYIGRVVAGDRKSAATNNHPSPTKIAAFGRLKYVLAFSSYILNVFYFLAHYFTQIVVECWSLL